MKYFVYLLAAVSATGNAESIPDPFPTPQNRPNPIPRGNPGNWATTNDYPSVALQKQVEGTTGFRVNVGPDGRVSDCVITASSGSPELDLATCTNVRRRARFEPALDANGSPTTGKYANRVRWQIPSFVPLISFPRGPTMQGGSWTRILPTDFPQKALAQKRQGIVKIELAISPNGAIQSCNILESSTHADLDAETCKIASNKAKFGPALDVTGQPTAGRVQTEINWRIPGDGDATSSGDMANTPLTMPKDLRPKAGATTVSFTVTADGSLKDCNLQSTIDPSSKAADAMCKLKIKFEPYTDAKGQPVARRVTTTSTVQIEEAK